MNYVMIPYKCKRIIYHVGRARDQYSSGEIGLVAGGKERKEGRQTVFCTPLDPFKQARVKRTSARAARSLATWPIPRTPQGAGGGGHESGLPAGREEDASETRQDGLLEEMGSHARMRRVDVREWVTS